MDLDIGYMGAALDYSVSHVIADPITGEEIHVPVRERKTGLEAAAAGLTANVDEAKLK